MKVIVITRPGGPEVLEIRERPNPKPIGEQVLVRVRAAGLNRADLLQRAGHYPPPPGAPADIPGLEFAGEIAGLGPEARLWREGQRVFGLAGGGAYAEYLVVHERTLAEIPPNLNWTQAAAIPEAFVTAQDALWKQAALRPGESLLVHAVGSGVGLAAVQLARAINAVPYGTSRTGEKLERAREFGMQDGVQLSGSVDALQAAVEHWTSGRGVDVVCELVGGPYVAASIRALALHGRLVVISSGAGSKVELDLRPLMSRRLTIRGTVLRARPLEEKIAAARSFAAEVVPLFARGVLRPVLDREYPLAEAAAAHARLESNQTFGKVVLRVD
jgi:putative PIG3 family NAD(P)H quinone oxidoreductase